MSVKITVSSLIMQSAAFGAVNRTSRAADDDIIANNHHRQRHRHHRQLDSIIIAFCLTIRAANAVCSRLRK